jgi:hypothetical protein
MKKIFAGLVVGGILVVGWSLQARQYTTPLYSTRALIEYPLSYHEEFERDCKCWTVDTGWIGYARSADRAYGTHDGTHKVGIGSLLFGKDVFSLAEAFPGGKVVIPGNPFVALSTLAPRLTYTEAGGIFSADFRGTFCWCGQNVHGGLRVRLPIRDVAMNHGAGPEGGSDIEGLTLGDVFMERMEVGTVNPQMVYAARLDFLSALTWQYPNVPMATASVPLVQYHNPLTDTVTIGGQTVNNPTDETTGDPSVALIGRTTGTMPVDQTWGLGANAITATLGTDGSGVGNNVRGAFAANTDYTPFATNTTAQSQLFVVPTLKADGTIGDAQVKTAIEQAVLPFQNGGKLLTVQGFLFSQGIDFYNGRSQGLGNMDFELYLGTTWGCDGRWRTDLRLGVTPPTGKKLHTSNNVIMLAPGNDGHTEVFIGAAAGWDMLYWLKIMADATYTSVLKSHEQVAAAFKGATVKNLGPSLDAQVKWGYFVGHALAAFYAYDCAAFNAEYELYYKQRDKITFDQNTATDWAGKTGQALDSSVVTKHTEDIAHKLRGGLLLKTGTWEVGGCLSYVIAGKNVPREMEWDVRFAITF